MDFRDQVKSSVDIVSVVGEYVRLRKAGTRYVGLCPFHQEKTPSFGVQPAHQYYKCFGCGAGGDVIKFVMEIEGLTFWEALTHLAERHGIPVPKQTRHSDEESKLREALLAMHDLAQQIFRRALDSNAGAAAREYIAKRGISPATAAEFGIGYVDRSGQTLTRLFERKGFGAADQAASGLVMRRQDGSGCFDRFRDRLMFPIHNESGKIIAFAGRALAPGDEPKYMNSPETPIYRKSHVLYNLHRARQAVRQTGRGILVEGYMDVIGLYDAGVLEAVASCGTALTEQQVRALRRHTDKIVVNYDADAAGTNAAERSVQMLLEEGMHIRVLELEGGLDPDEYVRRHGPDAYRRRLKQATLYFHWLADRVRKRYDMNSAEGRVAGLREVLLPAIERIPDRLERASVAEDVASYLRVDVNLILSEFRRTGGMIKGGEAVPPRREAVHPKEKLLIRLLLDDQRARAEVIPRLRPMKTIRRFQTWPVLRVMLELEEAGTGWSYADVEARVDDGSKQVLASVIFDDASGDQDASLEQALAFLPQLERKEREARLAEIKQQISAAEKSGDIQEALRLMAELDAG